MNLKLFILFLTPVFCFSQPGMLDNTFSSDGIQYVNFDGSNDYISSILIQPDGKILIAAEEYTCNTCMKVARLNVDGTPDLTFDLDGKVMTDLALPSLRMTDIVLQPDNKILISGYCKPGSDFDFIVIRLETNGALDTFLGGTGFVTIDIGGTDDYHPEIAIQPDGKIVLAGNSSPVPFGDATMSIIRLHPDGSLDTGWNGDGIIEKDMGSNENVTGMLIQPDGKPVVMGYFGDTAGYHCFTARFQDGGYPDSTYGTYGFSVDPTWDFPFDFTRQSDGKFVLTGQYYDPLDSKSKFCARRLNADGSIDMGFGTSGFVVHPVSTGNSASNGICLQPDGKILLAGAITDSMDLEIAVARLNSDGSLDNTFNGDGSVQTVTDPVSCGGSHVAMAPDGKIVVAGTSGLSPSKDVVIVRYLSGLTIGREDFQRSNATPLIYPNPVTSEAMLEFFLDVPERLTIRLLDIHGREVHVFAESVTRGAGKQKELLTFPDGLPEGTYIIQLVTDGGTVNVKVLKRQD